MYAPRKRAYKERPLVATTTAIDNEKWDDHVRAAFAASDEPFDGEKDAVIEYKGRVVSFQFIIEKADYHEHVKGRTHITRDTKKYINVNMTGMHRLILGLKSGQHDMQACHGPGGKLDNRKRTMRIDTNSGNQRDIKRKRPTSTSEEPGVCRNGKGMWQVQIRIKNKAYTLNGTESHDDAAILARKLYGMIPRLELMDRGAIDAEIDTLRATLLDGGWGEKFRALFDITGDDKHIISNMEATKAIKQAFPDFGLSFRKVSNMMKSIGVIPLTTKAGNRLHAGIRIRM